MVHPQPPCVRKSVDPSGNFEYYIGMFASYSLKAGNDSHLPVLKENLSDLVTSFPSPFVGLFSFDPKYEKVVSGIMQPSMVLDKPQPSALSDVVLDPDMFAALERIELINGFYETGLRGSDSAYVYISPMRSLAKAYMLDGDSSLLQEAAQNGMSDWGEFLFLRGCVAPCHKGCKEFPTKPHRRVFDDAASIAKSLLPLGAYRDAAVVIGPDQGPSALFRMDEFLENLEKIVQERCLK